MVTLRKKLEKFCRATRNVGVSGSSSWSGRGMGGETHNDAGAVCGCVLPFDAQRPDSRAWRRVLRLNDGWLVRVEHAQLEALGLRLHHRSTRRVRKLAAAPREGHKGVPDAGRAGGRASLASWSGCGRPSAAARRPRALAGRHPTGTATRPRGVPARVRAVIARRQQNGWVRLRDRLVPERLEVPAEAQCGHGSSRRGVSSTHAAATYQRKVVHHCLL